MNTQMSINTMLSGPSDVLAQISGTRFEYQ